VGDGVFVGANATIIEKLSIGQESVIGAGSVVICDIPASDRVVGNPSRSLLTVR